MGSVIEVSQLTKMYGSLRAVDQLSLSVEEGEVFGLLGPNGAGKTTMIRILNGILPFEDGKVTVFGQNPKTQGDTIRERTGVLTETPALYERLSARENLRFTGRMWDIPENRLDQRVDDVLELFDLTDRAMDKVGTYSKGMKQRMALARALLPQPPLLFLDEPTSGLDPESSQHVNAMIEKFGRSGNQTVFLCTHLLFEAQRLCDRVAVINSGRLLALGSPEELARDLFPGVRLQVRVGNAPSPVILTRLGQLEFLEEVSLEKDSLHVKIQKEALVPDLIQWLVEQKIRVYSVVPQEISLEEVYFTLQKRANGGVS